MVHTPDQISVVDYYYLGMCSAHSVVTASALFLV